MPERAVVRPERAYLRPERAYLRPERGLGGGDRCTYGWTDIWKSTPESYRTSALWGRCPKRFEKLIGSGRSDLGSIRPAFGLDRPDLGSERPN